MAKETAARELGVYTGSDSNDKTMELDTRAGNEDRENTGKINRLVVRDGNGGGWEVCVNGLLESGY